MNIDEVAHAAGVSTATVSRALSGRGSVSPATREKVVEAARNLGYVVSQAASTLASGRNRNVGIVVPFLDRWFFTNVLAGAQERLMHAGYDITLYNLAGRGDERRIVLENFLPRQRVDAVIAVSLELTECEVTRLRELGKPIVGVGGPIEGVRTLALDDIAASRLATEHLLSLGHTRIAHIGGDAASDRDFHMPLKRRRGYEQALRTAGIDLDEHMVGGADFTVQGSYRVAKLLLGRPQRPTAIFAASDEMAIGAILAAQDLGLSVPQDVSIIGIDDHDTAEFFGLTTIAHYPRAQGALAVDILLAQIEPNAAEPPAETPLPFDLIVRRTTSRPRPEQG
ncbi:LacI family DNA-binding transcriptional regulator [Microbacterium amylolyticum]|uniref:DNA-binding LacI/PurR family transcriptional regulator n=1 Tax=Microbacterium amylolyticum TaxID=936337 RepID=A0ABS4ZIE1_9MICO|nr:LacI family DNA-binding transcriptional regulator [Microbacterium amylolyticum]MBP2437031.1 DNA-binding LacI/PurR family transcriptional regulator [Microbacterium amylolyticum]